MRWKKELDRQFDLAGRFMATHGVRAGRVVDTRTLQMLLVGYRQINERAIHSDFHRWRINRPMQYPEGQ